MRVAPHENLARPDVALLGQQRVTHTRTAQLVVVFDLVTSGPLIQSLVQLGALDVLGRLKMVRRHHDLLRIENLVDALLDQHRNRRRRRHIVTHHHVDRRIYQLPRHDLLNARRPRQYLLRYRHSHRHILYLCGRVRTSPDRQIFAFCPVVLIFAF